MSETTIRPDLGFVNRVIASGGDSLKKCFQCATCTVVCGVTPDNKPFPRKEMIQAQWGLKDELLRNPDIWLCHQCSDCTAYCPRGAKPGEVLGAIRKISLEHYSVPGFLARAVGSPKALLLLLAVPVVIFLGILASLGNLDITDIPRGEDGGIVYANFIPVPYIDVVFIMAALFASAVFALGVLRYWKDMAGGPLNKWQKVLGGGIMGAVATVGGDILAHNRFRKCNVTGGRAISHLLVFYSFVGLAITTTIAIFYLYGLKWESPYPLSDPMKILGNISAAALVLGILLVIINRVKNAKKAGAGGYFDWLFILVITAIVVTGILSEVLRLADAAVLAYPTYFVHLVAVFFLFAYAPFSKMAHMVYRATAMVYDRLAGRSR